MRTFSEVFARARHFGGIAVHYSPLLRPEEVVYFGDDVFAGYLGMVDLKFAIVRAEVLGRIKDMFQDEYAAMGMWCHAHQDGECSWTRCPQARDGEPKATGRNCPRADKYRSYT